MPKVSAKRFGMLWLQLVNWGILRNTNLKMKHIPEVEQWQPYTTMETLHLLETLTQESSMHDESVCFLKFFLSAIVP